MNDNLKTEPPTIVIYLRVDGRVAGAVASAPVRVLMARCDGTGIGLPGWGMCQVTTPPVAVNADRVEVVLALAAPLAKVTGTPIACSRL